MAKIPGGFSSMKASVMLFPVAAWVEFDSDPLKIEFDSNPLKIQSAPGEP